MPRKNIIDELKKGAPEIPTNTCAYIDFVLEILKEIKEESPSHQIGEKIDLIESHMEYLRYANQSLRDGGEYWYRECVTQSSKK
ncbi:MAG: hypothetical protein CBC05_08945 [Crocinitomicaceae bacterium TMED45]|nr:MAG: hypothetical protein CBC05_08945 [Crocinitomicaceae bacterium TMED45]|tara:strand:- start:2328 stop:2579 length:252 start_codon:yes stop_codon:yes gene_type:complete